MMEEYTVCTLSDTSTNFKRWITRIQYLTENLENEEELEQLLDVLMDALKRSTEGTE